MDSRYPNIKQSIIMLLLIILLMFLLYTAAGVLFRILNIDDSQNHFTLGIVNLMAIGFFILRAKKKTNCAFKDIYPLKTFNLIALVPVILIMTGGGIILSEIDNVFRTFFPMPEWIKEPFLSLTMGTGHIISSLFVLSIVAPITEELLFRGLILQGFLNQYSIKKSLLVSSLLFALFHLNPWQFVSALFLGLVFSWWFVHFRSLLPCLIGHAYINFFPILLKLTDIRIPGLTTVEADGVFQPLWLDIGGIVLFIGGMLLMRRFFIKYTYVDGGDL